MPFTRRLGRIVDVVFDGNVTAAAQVAGVPVPTLHRILQGSVANPRLATLRALADAYGVPLGWILGDVTTQQAQDLGPVALSEPLWLILAHHQQRQNSLRQKIKDTVPRTAVGRRLKDDFTEFNFLPFTAEEPLSDALDHLCTLLDLHNKNDLRLVREWAALSTSLLESALAKLRQVERDAD